MLFLFIDTSTMLDTTTYINYRPQTKFAKVVFSQVSVCPQRGVCLWSQVHAGIHTPRQTPPGQTPLGRYSPGRHPMPSACWDTPPCPVYAGIHTPALPCACQDAVSKRAVRIPLECILVWNLYLSIIASNGDILFLHHITTFGSIFL